MKLSECKVGLEVISELSQHKGEIGFITGFGENGIEEVIPVVKWGVSEIESEIHWSNIELSVDLTKLEKPPIGIMPRHIYNDLRAKEIIRVMGEFMECGEPIKAEWVEELSDLVLNTL